MVTIAERLLLHVAFSVHRFYQDAQIRLSLRILYRVCLNSGKRSWMEQKRISNQSYSYNSNLLQLNAVYGQNLYKSRAPQKAGSHCSNTIVTPVEKNIYMLSILCNNTEHNLYPPHASLTVLLIVDLLLMSSYFFVAKSLPTLMIVSRHFPFFLTFSL